MWNLIKVRRMREEYKLPAYGHVFIIWYLPVIREPERPRLPVLWQGFIESSVSLSEGQLIETDRSRLVAGYVGQTAINVREVVEQAIGGVLFIDEA